MPTRRLARKCAKTLLLSNEWRLSNKSRRQRLLKFSHHLRSKIRARRMPSITLNSRKIPSLMICRKKLRMYNHLFLTLAKTARRKRYLLFEDHRLLHKGIRSESAKVKKSTRNCYLLKTRQPSCNHRQSLEKLLLIKQKNYTKTRHIREAEVHPSLRKSSSYLRNQKTKSVHCITS